MPSARSGLRQIVDGLLETGPFRTWRDRQEPVEVDSIPVILRLVADHGFVSFLPAASLPGNGRFAALPLPHPVTLPLYAAWPRGRGDHGLVAQVVAMAKGK